MPLLFDHIFSAPRGLILVPFVCVCDGSKCGWGLRGGLEVIVGVGWGEVARGSLGSVTAMDRAGAAADNQHQLPMSP